MKKLLLILLCVPLIGFGQSDYWDLATEAEANGQDQLAIDYYTKCLEYRCMEGVGTAFVYYMRGTAYARLGNYEASIDDLTNVIKVDPDNNTEILGQAYTSRGIVKQKVNLPFCDDWEKACLLGDNSACSWWNNDCSNSR